MNKRYNKGSCNAIMKVCSECKRELSDDMFYKRTYKSGKTGLQHNCRDCSSAIRKRYHKPHTSIRLKLKLTQAQVDELTAPGKCEVCESTDRLCIDHSHETGKPRGLLCHKCNTALGLLGDNVDVILGLSQYLAQSKPLV